jgi:hypothetical protein
LFFFKIDKIDKLLANVTKQSGEKTQINKITQEKWDITTNLNWIQRVIREYIKNIQSNKWQILQQIHKFLDAYDQPKLSHKDIKHLNTYTYIHIYMYIYIKQAMKLKQQQSIEKKKAQDLMDLLLNCTRSHYYLHPKTSGTTKRIIVQSL